MRIDIYERKRKIEEWIGQDTKSMILHEQLIVSILERAYDYLALININRKTIYIDFDDVRVTPDLTGQEVSYNEARRTLADAYIIPEERRDFLQHSDLSKVIEQLETQSEYFFTRRVYGENGTISTSMFRFFYLDESRECIVATLEDRTDFLNRDPLTGEYNRTGFIKEATRILDSGVYGKDLAVLCINIRGFKAVNDIFGADGGDLLLRRMPIIIRNSELKPLLVARETADHFFVLTTRQNIDMDYIRSQLHQSFELHNRHLEISAVCGIYYIDDPENHRKISKFCDAATMALMYIEDEFVNPVIVFDETMRNHYKNRTDISRNLTKAMEENEIVVYYQPVYDAKTHKIASAEALARWKRNNGEMVSPGLFIPALEESGRISELDLHIERQVIDFLEKRSADEKSIVPVSMNLSKMDFYDKNMLSEVMNDVHKTSLPADYTRFEMTETAYAHVTDDHHGILRRMRDYGVLLYLDDFGSGYSSFSAIHDYDFDVIKLDIGFVRHIGESERSDSVIRTIIDLAHTLGSKVVAEGAETKEQVDFLTENHCDYIQGYYFSKPLPEEEFAKLLDEAV